MSDLESLSSTMRDLKKEFNLIIEPYRPILWRYCRAMTGSPWDAEDLVQETLTKTYAALPKLWQPIFPKSLLFRIATNTWINHCRKNNVQLDVFDDSTIISHDDADPFVVREAISALMEVLPPRQAVVVLLRDVFEFRASEVSEIMGIAEGAVKSILHRARAKLKAVQTTAQENIVMESPISYSPVVEEFIKAFNKRDPDAIAALLDDNATNDIIHVAVEYGREYIRKYSLNGWANDPIPMIAYNQVLWGKTVIIVLADYENNKKLYSIIELEHENNIIQGKKNYYFCQDLLAAAGEELNYPVLQNGYNHD
jgi:RNA polymerase sigma factor (sigma-70 family)